MTNAPRFPAQTIVERYGFQPRAGSIQYLSCAGGFSGADFWRFASDGQDALCLRRWPTGTRAQRVAEVHAVLFQAAAAGIGFLAVPLRDKNGNSFFQFDNRIVELTTWLDGHADYRTAPSSTRLQNAMNALAKFHHAVAQNLQFEKRNQVAPGIVARKNRVAQLASGRFQQIGRAVDNNRSHELAPLAQSILLRVTPQMFQLQIALDECARITVPTQLCLRDVRHDHVLFIGDRVSGIVDYDAIQIDSVALDVARLAQSLVENDRQQWKAAVNAYAAARHLNENEYRLFPVLLQANPVLSAISWLEWLFLDLRQFDDMRRVKHRISRLAIQLDWVSSKT